MNDQPDLASILSNRAVLLAVCEQVSRSMNGASSRRFAIALDDLLLDAELVDPDDARWLSDGLQNARSGDRIRFWTSELKKLEGGGIYCVSCTDPGYPTNLAMIHDRPPVLFVRGSLLESDVRSIAVVGTRSASEEGVRVAKRISAALVESGITVISGLAAGIDAAAHAAAIEAGGRTIAVFGTTIDRTYPAKNRDLALSVSESGACVSQFLPATKTGPWSFPVRNVTTSGLSLGTIVVEAAATSGARLQAEAALAHGKRVFLVDRLVTSQSWAREMSSSPMVTVASTPADIVRIVDAEVAPRNGVLI